MSNELVTIIGQKIGPEEATEYKNAKWAPNPKGKIKSGDLIEATEKLLSKLKVADLNQISPKAYLSKNA